MTEDLITKTDGKKGNTTPNIETKLSVDEARYKMCEQVANLSPLFSDSRCFSLREGIEEYQRVRKEARKVIETDSYDKVIKKLMRLHRTTLILELGEKEYNQMSNTMG